MRRSRLVAGGVALALMSGAGVAASEERTRTSEIWQPRPPLAEAQRRSGAERLLEGVASEAQYSGARLGRILSASRDGVLDLFRTGVELLPREAPPRAAAAPMAVPPVDPAQGPPRRGPEEAQLSAMLQQLYALHSPPIADLGDRPVPPLAGAVPRDGTAGDGSSTGARRLLDRLEARGDIEARPTEQRTRFTAVLPPAGLESRFESWNGNLVQAVEEGEVEGEVEGEEGLGFTSRCLDRQGGPSDPLYLVQLRGAAPPAEPAALDTHRYAAVHLAALVPDEPRRLSDGSVFLPKLTQRLLGVRTVLACVDEMPRVEQLIGHVIANPNASGLVQAGQTGRIRPGPNGLPELGMPVRAGQPLAVLEPNISTVDRGQLESQLAELRSEIIRSELELARMRDFPIVPFRTGRMLALRLELDGLRKRRDALIAGLDNHEVLLSPMDGVVAQADIVAGQLAQAGGTLWKIVDPQRMRIEAIAYDEPSTREIRGAWALTSDNEAMRLAFVGRGLTLTNQGIPLHFEIRDHSEGIGVGTPVAVYVNVGGGERAVVLPKGALVRDDAGRTVVWEHVDGERFVARPVHAEPLNGQQVLVRAGIQENARIVHVGATHFSQIR